MTRIPKLCLHRTSRRYYVRLGGRQVYLGKDRKAAERERQRLVGEWLVAGGAVPASPRSDLTVSEVAARYVEHAESYYRLESGELSSELNWITSALEPLRRLYGPTFARDFGPLALEVVRNDFIDAGYTRKAINSRVLRIRRCFKWACGRELIPASISHGLAALDGLRKGRTKAAESEPIGPVADEVVEATLLHLPEVVADMVRLQRLTGMRPAEVCSLRPMELDRTRKVWRYTRPRVTGRLHFSRLKKAGP